MAILKVPLFQRIPLRNILETVVSNSRIECSRCFSREDKGKFYTPKAPVIKYRVPVAPRAPRTKLNKKNGMGARTIAFFYSRRNSRATKYSPRKTSQVPVCDHGIPPHAFAPIPPHPSPHREGAFLLLLILLPWYTQVSRARRGGGTVAAGKGHNTRRPRKPHTTFPLPHPFLPPPCCTRASSSSPSSLTPQTVTQRPPGPAAPPHTGCERAHTGERTNTLTCRRRAKNLRRAGGGKKRTREARGTDQLTDRPTIHRPAVPITSA